MLVSFSPLSHTFWFNIVTHYLCTPVPFYTISSCKLYLWRSAFWTFFFDLFICCVNIDINFLLGLYVFNCSISRNRNIFIGLLWFAQLSPSSLYGDTMPFPILGHASGKRSLWSTMFCKAFVRAVLNCSANI